MAVDPLISLAVALHAHSGTYAILLGSGVSSAAGIPTGWSVTNKLIASMAVAQGEVVPVDVDTWYREKYGKAPAYSDVVSELAPSAEDRMTLLKSYFEPTPEERAKGLKVPTAAHHAIAKLVSEGAIRVIVTTNFDRLMELALEAAGIHATVVASADQVTGMMPLQHNGCVLIKVHGDYLDTRIRNTEQELAAYEPTMNELLDRVFSEYGLVVCGWSGDWDPALVGAITRATRFRFTTYWMAKGDPSLNATDLIARRRAVVIPIGSADSALKQLGEKVEALSSQRLRDPVSTQMVLASVKRYLAESRHRIDLEDIVVREMTSTLGQLSNDRCPLGAPQPDEKSFADRVAYMDAASSGLATALCAGAYWGSSEHDTLWQRCVAALAKRPLSSANYHVWELLRYYPLNLAIYCAGTACILRKRYGLLRLLLCETPSDCEDGAVVVSAIGAHYCLDRNLAQSLIIGNDKRNLKTPSSDWLSERVVSIVRNVVGPDLDGEYVFDELEILLTLVGVDAVGRGCYGRFTWRHWHWYDKKKNPLATMLRGIQQRGKSHPILQAGFFGGDPMKFESAAKTVDEVAARMGLS